MTDTQPLAPVTADGDRSPEVIDQESSTTRPPIRDRRLGWLPVLAVAVTAVVLGALIGFGLGRATGGGTTGPGGFGGPGGGQFQRGFPGQQGQAPGQQGQQFGGPQGQQGTQPQQPAG